MPPLCQRKLLKYCPQEQELYALFNCVISNGESPYLRSSRLWMVVGNKLFFGGPKLRQRVPLQPSHRRYVPSLLPDDAAQSPTARLWASQFYLLFSSKILPVRPLTASTQVQHTRRHPSVPQLPYNVQTKSQTPGDHHHQGRLFCETGREGLFKQKMNSRSAHPLLASTYTSSRTSHSQGYLPPTPRHTQNVPQSKKIQVSHILRRKSPPPPRPSR